METYDYENQTYNDYNTEYAEQWVQLRLDMSDAVMDVLRHSLRPFGRAARSEFWWWILFAAIISIAGIEVGTRTTLSFIGMIAVAIVVLPTISAMIRRLHDTDHSAWNMLFLFVPVIGWIWLLLLLLAPSTEGENDYGEQPNLVRADLL